jgi:hypothetical protein
MDETFERPNPQYTAFSDTTFKPCMECAVKLFVPDGSNQTVFVCQECMSKGIFISCLDQNKQLYVKYTPEGTRTFFDPRLEAKKECQRKGHTWTHCYEKSKCIHCDFEIGKKDTRLFSLLHQSVVPVVDFKTKY